MRKEFRDNDIQMDQLAIDLQTNELLPLPTEVIDHILYSGREIFNTDYSSEKLSIPQSSINPIFIPDKSLKDILEIFEKEEAIYKEKQNEITDKLKVIDVKSPKKPKPNFVTEFLQVQASFNKVLKSI